MSALGIGPVDGSSLDFKAAFAGADLATDDIEDEGQPPFRMMSDDNQTAGFESRQACEGKKPLRAVLARRQLWSLCPPSAT
jgi:hypothetical protein